jgi:hypothetical protein
VAGALVAALVDPASRGSDRASDAVSIALVGTAGYLTMRILVWVAARPLAARLPRLVRAWGLTWFYGAIPLALVGLFIGTLRLDAVTPNATTVAFVVVAVASMAAGAFPAVRAAAWSSDNRWRGP